MRHEETLEDLIALTEVKNCSRFAQAIGVTKQFVSLATKGYQGSPALRARFLAGFKAMGLKVSSARLTDSIAASGRAYVASIE